MDIVNPRISRYLHELFDDSDPVRHEMERLAQKRHFPIVGALVGRKLAQLVYTIGARRVFELGSGFGYSALFFTRAVGQSGEVHCTDLDEDNVRQAKDFLSRAGVWDRVTYHCEEATAALERVGGSWDIIYNDIDKQGYPEVVELAYRHLRPGGLFVSDNVLWHGRVLPDEDDSSAATIGIKEFTRSLLAHQGFHTTIDPTRDGVAIALKVG